MKRLLAILVLLLPVTAHATPSISSISGDVSYGSDLTITGTGFGTKPGQQQTLMYANFEADVNPSSWSFITTWSNQANDEQKTTTCEEGTGCLGEVAGWDTTASPNKVTAAVVLSAPVAAGDKNYESWDWQSDAQDVGTTANLKTFRWWATAGSFKLNDIYGAQQCDTSYVYFTENDDGIVNSSTRFYSRRLVANHSAYTQVIVQAQFNSALGATDGIMQTFLDGNSGADSSTWLSNTPGDSANGRYQEFFPVHYEFTSGGTCPAPYPTVHVPINDGTNPHYVRYDNVIVEDSWCVVWFSTQSTEALGVKRFYMPVKSWTSTSITVVCTNKYVTAGNHLYVHVMENGGTINATGYDLVSQQSAGSPAPTVTSLSVVSGPAAGGTSTTITGTNFVSGCTVAIGTTTVTPTFNSATSLTVTTPTGPPGAADVKVTNPDTQNATLAGGFTWVAAPSLTSITPSQADIAGGTNLAVVGTGFVNGCTVKFGTTNAAAVVFNSATSLTVTTPALSFGTYDFIVTNPDGQTTKIASGYTALAPAPARTFPFVRP